MSFISTAPVVSRPSALSYGLVNTSATLTSNAVEECSGNAFVINGAAVVDNNSAADNGGYGFVLTNLAPGSMAFEWSIQGVGDLDGNGSDDILWRHTSGTVAIWLMDTNGGVLTTRVFDVAPDWTLQGVKDFNGDGKADLVWRHTSGSVYLWFMNGTNIDKRRLARHRGQRVDDPRCR